MKMIADPISKPRENMIFQIICMLFFFALHELQKLFSRFTLSTSLKFEVFENMCISA